MVKTISYILLSLLLLGSIFSGCSDQLAPTISNQKSIAATDNTERVLMKGPPSESGKVIRYNGEYWAWFRDYDAGYTLYLGVKDMIDFCDYIDDFDEFDFKDIFLPSTDPLVAERWIGMIKGDDIQAFVWTWTDPSTQGCDYYLDNAPMAGPVKVINVDNDVMMWDPQGREPKNANSFGWSANGTLEGPDGQLYKLNFSYRHVWKWTWDPSQDKINLKIHLTPKG
ncbi:hypothetical protein ACFL4B_04480 [Candidatus Neomarinimicrobiota bacterium]